MLDTTPDSADSHIVWPYYFLAAVGGFVALVIIAVWWPESFPDKDELVMVNGDIATVRIKDDISGTSAGALMPAVTSVYFTFRNQDGEYFYPSTQPDYRMVRDFTAVNIDVWVENDALGRGDPVRIWQIVEHNPYNLVLEATNVSYEKVVARLEIIDRSMVVAGYYLLALCFGSVLLGMGLQHINRRRDEEGY
ncbi:MAG: hypothetical protein VYA71_03595 [Pseudomonadota bacterium]|nr:hypothetical protein [Pseudomonadota bacterium]